MTPLEERLQQALSARADLVTRETVYPARPPAPARNRPSRLAMTATVLVAAAAVVLVTTVTLTSLGRLSSAPGGPNSTGTPTVALTSPPMTTTGSLPSPSERARESPAESTPRSAHLPGIGQPGSTRTETVTTSPDSLALLPARLGVRPAKGPAGSVVSFYGNCPVSRPEDAVGAVSSKAFLQDSDHDVDGVGGQTFEIHKDGTFAGSAAVPPDVTAGDYDVFLWCGKTTKPQLKAGLTVLAAQQPATDAMIVLAAHAVYPGEWIAFMGVCQNPTPASGWVISPAFEDIEGHDYAGVGAVPFSTDSQGLFVGTAHIPADHPAGAYKVTVRCNGGNLGVTESLDVLAAQ